MNDTQFYTVINVYSKRIGMKAGSSKITLERAEKLVDKLIEWYDYYEEMSIIAS